jgi:hypothetical protein
MPEHPASALIPALYDSIQVFADDGIVVGIDDSREKIPGIIRSRCGLTRSRWCRVVCFVVQDGMAPGSIELGQIPTLRISLYILDAILRLQVFNAPTGRLSWRLSCRD